VCRRKFPPGTARHRPQQRINRGAFTKSVLPRLRLSVTAKLSCRTARDSLSTTWIPGSAGRIEQDRGVGPVRSPSLIEYFARAPKILSPPKTNCFASAHRGGRLRRRFPSPGKSPGSRGRAESHQRLTAATSSFLRMKIIPHPSVKFLTLRWCCTQRRV